MLAVLSLSFIFTTILVHTFDNPFTDTIYVGASVWLGFVWYLALAILLVWVIKWLGNIASVNIPLRLVATVLIIIAAGYSAYGIWNAFAVRVNRITVHLPNLPASWQGRKAILMTDIHLGPELRANFMKKLVDLTQQEKPDIVFLGGDLFDGSGADVGHLVDSLNTLNPSLGSYFITGNHEMLLGFQKSLDALRSTNVKVLQNEIVIVDGVQVAGFDFQVKPSQNLIKSVLNTRDPSKALITLYHVPTLTNLFKQNGVNLQLSGHAHKGQVWPFGIITRLVYHGYDIGLHTDGDYSIYTSTGAGTWGPPMRTGNRPEIVAITFE